VAPWCWKKWLLQKVPRQSVFISSRNLLRSKLIESGETSASATPPPEDPAVNKEPLKIRCLLFFDGTLNNRGNIDERVKHESGQSSKIYLKNRVNQDKETRLAKGAAGIDLEDDSYENDYSNIATLEANTATEQPDYDETVVIYTEGAGTLKYEENPDGSVGDNKDRQAGYAFAAGISGIKAKVERGINDAVAKIAQEPIGKGRVNEQFYIEKLTFDLFGFSRGAASARYCVHRLLEFMDTYDEYGNIVETTETYIQRRLRANFLDVREVEIRFVGLFDTVVSYKAAQAVKLGGSLENWLVKQKAISNDKVKKVVHLVSAEEHRDQFCLHNIKSAGGKGEEYFLPGVHSDVGGGYLDHGSDAGLIVCQANPYWAQKDRDDYLVALGWYKPEQLVEKVLTTDDVGVPDYVQLEVTRDSSKARIVRNAYCKIPLKIMVEKAGESGIKIKPALETIATEAINAFPELAKLETRIKSHMDESGPRGSKPEKWQQIDTQKNGLNEIRHQHLHFSARYNGKFNGLGHNPNRTFFGFERKRHVFNG
jgi:hypothetical protein